MKTAVIIFITILIVFSCKKQTFDHQDTSISYSCKCCQLTDSIEGNYVGRYIERIAYTGPSGPIYDTLVDTIVSVQFQKIFLNQDFISDSLFCKFEVSGYINGIVYFANDNLPYMGRLDFDPNFFQSNYFDLNNNGDLIFNNTTYYNHYYSYTSTYFKGIKQ